jgi:hypothetical protein
MRTTLTLEPEVARRVESELRRTGKTLKAVINEALKAGLGMTGKPVEPLPPFVVRPHDFGFHAGIDPDRMNQLADELETDAILEKLRQGK